jgi:hypothetical protein
LGTAPGQVRRDLFVSDHAPVQRHDREQARSSRAGFRIAAAVQQIACNDVMLLLLVRTRSVKRRHRALAGFRVGQKQQAADLFRNVSEAELAHTRITSAPTRLVAVPTGSDLVARISGNAFTWWRGGTPRWTSFPRQLRVSRAEAPMRECAAELWASRHTRRQRPIQALAALSLCP